MICLVGTCLVKRRGERFFQFGITTKLPAFLTGTCAASAQYAEAPGYPAHARTATAQKAAALTDDIRTMVDAADVGLIGTTGAAGPVVWD
jgi:hypothetical protein